MSLQDSDETTCFETTPLLIDQDQRQQSKSSDNFAIFIATTLPSVFLGLLLTLLQTISYGILIFPTNDPHLPSSVSSAGISIFLFSSLIAQLVFAVKSGFVGISGLMMLEVIPFLHLICKSVEAHMSESGNEAILATIVVVYGLSTIVTGLLFLVIGVFRLGVVVSYFPRHILLGCIGGLHLIKQQVLECFCL